MKQDEYVESISGVNIATLHYSKLVMNFLSTAKCPLKGIYLNNQIRFVYTVQFLQKSAMLSHCK
uniref:Uncharacterized protein n=1 Tax=Arundo donax TaxID=35708 RepID=A0A0A8ZXL4_ARUDO